LGIYAHSYISTDLSILANFQVIFAKSVFTFSNNSDYNEMK